MGIFSKLFRRSNRRHPMDDKPPLFGGDGSSNTKAVIVNCASMAMANHLIDRFISERHGQAGLEWRRWFETFDNADNLAAFTIRIIGVELSDKTQVRYYFDVSRPMAGTKNVAKMMEGITRGN